MEDEDTFPFVLALDLHRTLGEIDAMPYPEYLSWQAYYTWRAAMDEFEQKRRA
jgi:hypothetical protein